MRITTSTFEEVEQQFTLNKFEEGIVLLGAGGNLQEWIDGVSTMLFDEQITKTSDPSKLWKAAYQLKTTGGRIDLVLPFKNMSLFNMGKMAMWRIRFGECSWISDWFRNYRDHYLTESRSSVDEGITFEKERHFLQLQLEREGYDTVIPVMTHSFVLTSYEYEYYGTQVDANRRRIYLAKEEREEQKAIKLFAKELIKWYAEGKYNPKKHYFNVVWGIGREILNRWDDHRGLDQLHTLVDQGIEKIDKKRKKS